MALTCCLLVIAPLTRLVVVGVVPAEAAAADQGEPVDRLDAELAVDAETVGLRALLNRVVHRRLGQRRVPAVDVLVAGDHTGALQHGDVLVLVVSTQDDVVLLAEQLERFADMRIDGERTRLVVARQPARVGRVAAAGDDVAVRRSVAVRPSIEEVGIRGLIACGELGVATVVELVFQFTDIVG